MNAGAASSAEHNTVTEAVALVNAINVTAGRRVAVLLGSVAVAALCPEAPAVWAALGRRSSKDIDLVFGDKSPYLALQLLDQCGCTVTDWKESYCSTGRIYARSPSTTVGLELFFEPLEFYQRLPPTRAFAEGAATLLPEELLISKLQYKELPREQQIDIYALLTYLQAEQLAERFAERVISQPKGWSLWQACDRSLDAVKQFVSHERPHDVPLINARIESLRKAVESGYKPLRWRLRQLIPIQGRGYAVEPPRIDRE